MVAGSDPAPLGSATDVKSPRISCDLSAKAVYLFATLSIPDVHPLVGEDSFPGGGYDNWKGCSAGQRQRLLNRENFSHIVDKNEGQD